MEQFLLRVTSPGSRKPTQAGSADDPVARNDERNWILGHRRPYSSSRLGTSRTPRDGSVACRLAPVQLTALMKRSALEIRHIIQTNRHVIKTLWLASSECLEAIYDRLLVRRQALQRRRSTNRLDRLVFLPVPKGRASDAITEKTDGHPTQI